MTDKPVTHLIYSHFHADHIGAAHVFGDDVEIVAQRETLRMLVEAADPKRPLPTVTFDDEFKLSFGGGKTGIELYRTQSRIRQHHHLCTEAKSPHDGRCCVAGMGFRSSNLVLPITFRA